MAKKAGSRDETTASNRAKRAAAREQALTILRSIPKTLYIEMSGRQSRTLNEQAETYGIPVGGEKVDLSAVVRWIHDTFGKHGRELVPLIGVRSRRTIRESDDDLFGEGAEDGDGGLWLARCREKKSKLLDLELQQKEGSLVPRSEMREVLDRAAGMVSGLIEDLERKFGPDAADLAEKALDGLQREISSSFGERDAA